MSYNASNNGGRNGAGDHEQAGSPPTFAPYLWLDGRLVPFSDAKVHVLSHGLHYGTGAFEGMRSYSTPAGPAIFRLEDHLRRWRRSADAIRLRIPFDEQELVHACETVLVANDLTEAYLRPIAFYGLGPLGFSLRQNAVHVAIAAWRWGAYMGEGLADGIRLRSVPWLKTPARASPSSAKLCGNYVNSTLAFQAALADGYDEALLLDAEGLVCEGSGENVFIVEDGTVSTPPTSADILPGITRDTALHLLRTLGVPAQERTFDARQVAQADEVFLTGTAAEVTPVRVLDDRTIGDGTPGPITNRLQAAFFDLVHGRSGSHPAWLHTIPLVSALNGGI